MHKKGLTECVCDFPKKLTNVALNISKFFKEIFTGGT